MPGVESSKRREAVTPLAKLRGAILRFGQNAVKSPGKTHDDHCVTKGLKFRAALFKCESIVEKQKGKQESKRSEQVKEQTLKRANMRGRLNPRMSLHPVKKGFNRLSATADIGAEAVSRLQNIIRPFLSWSRKFKGIHLP